MLKLWQCIRVENDDNWNKHEVSYVRETKRRGAGRQFGRSTYVIEEYIAKDTDWQETHVQKRASDNL